MDSSADARPVAATTTLADRLRAARVTRGLTQLDLAVQAQVSLSSVVHIEHSLTTAPLWSTILRLAGALGVDPTWLRWGDAGAVGRATVSPGRAGALTGGRQARIDLAACHILTDAGQELERWRYAEFADVRRRGVWVTLLALHANRLVERALLETHCEADALLLERALRAALISWGDRG